MAAVAAGAVTVAAVSWAAVAGFPDVAEDHPYADDIAIVAERGWYVGFEDGTFGPDREMTVSQFTRVFRRAFAEVNPTRAMFAAVLKAGTEHMYAIRSQTAPGAAPAPPTAGTPPPPGYPMCGRIIPMPMMWPSPLPAAGWSSAKAARSAPTAS